MNKIKLFALLCIHGLLFKPFSCNAQNLTIANKYVDNHLVAKYYINNGRVVKYIGYGNSIREEINYKYSQDGKLLKVTFKGNNNVSGSTDDLEKKYYKDWLVQQNFLCKKIRINVPISNINTDEVSDISYFFSSEAKYSDTAIGNIRILSIKNINKKYRFYPSELESFITIDNVINEYRLSLKKDTVTQEEIFFDKGLLTRTYSWQSPNTLVVKINCVYDNKEQAELVKKIILHTKVAH